MRAFAVGQRREMAEHAVARRGASIAFACRAFGVSETCYRYGPKLRAENEEIADLLLGLTEARSGLVSYSCRSKCSFRPPCVRRPRGFFLPMLNADGVGYGSR